MRWGSEAVSAVEERGKKIATGEPYRERAEEREGGAQAEEPTVRS